MKFHSIAATTTCAISAAFGTGTAELHGQIASPVYYPQATTTEAVGNWPVLGSLAWFDAESRYQVLIPSFYLPQEPATLIGIAVTNHGPISSFTYDMMEVAVSNASVAALSPAFDLNLVNPSIVLSGAPVTVPYSQRNWSELPISPTFTHDGTSSIVIDIRKAINRSAHLSINVEIQTTCSPQRNDLPRVIWDIGQFPGGAFYSTQATLSGPQPIKVRLTFANVPSLYIRSDVSGSASLTFQRLGNVTITVNGASGSLYALLASPTFQAPASVPGVVGRWLLAQPAFVFADGVLPGTGSTSTSSSIPPDPTLRGQRVALQAIVATNGSVHLTNAVDAIVN